MTMLPKSGVTGYSTPSDTQVMIVRVLNAPRTVVWRAYTDPAYIAQWLLGPPGWTMPVCEVDLRVGGKWRYVYEKTGGTGMTLAGEYREVVPPERLVSTEAWGPEWPVTTNTMVLAETDGVTTLTITITYPSKDARDAALQTGMKGGVDMGFDRLDTLLPTML